MGARFARRQWERTLQEDNWNTPFKDMFLSDVRGPRCRIRRLIRRRIGRQIILRITCRIRTKNDDSSGTSYPQPRQRLRGASMWGWGRDSCVAERALHRIPTVSYMSTTSNCIGAVDAYPDKSGYAAFPTKTPCFRRLRKPPSGH